MAAAYIRLTRRYASPAFVVRGTAIPHDRFLSREEYSAILGAASVHEPRVGFAVASSRLERMAWLARLIWLTGLGRIAFGQVAIAKRVGLVFLALFPGHLALGGALPQMRGRTIGAGASPVVGCILRLLLGGLGLDDVWIFTEGHPSV